MLLPPGWTHSFRIERGREARVVQAGSPEADESNDTLRGVKLAPGEADEIKMTVCEGDSLRYELRCEDALDIGFEVRLQREHAAELVLLPWSRTTGGLGEAVCEAAGTCSICLDNNHAWIHARTVHATFEILPAPATSIDGRAQHGLEELELRRSYVSSLRTEEEQLARRASKLRRQLEVAERELARVREVLATASAPAAAPLLTSPADASPADEALAVPADEAEADPAGIEAQANDVAATHAPAQSSASVAVDTDVMPTEAAGPRSRHILWALWRRLALIDPHVSVDAVWFLKADADFEEEGGEGSECGVGGAQGDPDDEADAPAREDSASSSLLLREVVLQGVALRRLGWLRTAADVDRLVRLCTERLAQAGPSLSLSSASATATLSSAGQAPPLMPLHSEQPGGVADDGLPPRHSASAEGYSLEGRNTSDGTRHCPTCTCDETTRDGECVKRDNDAIDGGSGRGSNGSNGNGSNGGGGLLRNMGRKLVKAAIGYDDGRADGSALDRLRLLSKLLLEMDASASMDVAPAGEHAYELLSVTLQGKTLSSGFGSITDQTNVRLIAEALGKATAISDI